MKIFPTKPSHGCLDLKPCPSVRTRLPNTKRKANTAGFSANIGTHRCGEPLGTTWHNGVWSLNGWQKRHWIYCPSRMNCNLNGKISFKWGNFMDGPLSMFDSRRIFSHAGPASGLPLKFLGAKLSLSLSSATKSGSPKRSRGKTAKARAVNTPKASKTPVLPHQKACSGVSWAYPKVAPPPSQNLFPSPTNMTLPFLDAWKMC